MSLTLNRENYAPYNIGEGFTQRDYLASEVCTSQGITSTNPNFYHYRVGLSGLNFGERVGDLNANIRHATLFGRNGVRILDNETRWEFTRHSEEHQAELSAGFLSFVGRLGEMTMEGVVSGTRYALRDTVDRALATGMFVDLISASVDLVANPNLDQPQ